MKVNPAGLTTLLVAAAMQIHATEIEAVLAHPLFRGYYTCTEHAAGQFNTPGDALGTDCMPERFDDVHGRLWLRPYRAQGLRNEDWYAYHQPVLSPCDCTVADLRLNPVVNRPGILGKGIASFVSLRRDDGTMFLLAHIAEPRVVVGQQVKAGDTLAIVGNNGQSRHPHIHIGAWRNTTPLQLRFDQNFMTGE